MNIELVYIICSVLLWWGYAGYVLFLFFTSRLGKKESGGDADDVSGRDYPSVTVIVPCFNEEDFIGDKIGNLRSLDYPQDKLDVVFADGGSTDGTKKVIEDAIKNIPNYRFIETKKKGKIHQMNEVLGGVESDIIVNTDVDGVMEENCLIEMVKEFKRDENVGVVGAYVTPQDCMPEEKVYWEKNNVLRLLESNFYSSSIVIAVCYAFKRNVLDRFPEEVIADDIYVSFKAAFSGFRVVYAKDAHAYEMRASKSFRDLMKQKMRRSNAFLIEIFRFLGKTFKTNTKWNVIFLTRSMQLILLPLLIPIYVLVSYILFLRGDTALVLESFFAVGLSLFLAHILFNRVNAGLKPDSADIYSTIKVFFIMNLIQLASLISYPFFKQTSSYEKIK